MDIGPLIAEFRSLPPHAAIARVSARLRREELAGSLAIAESPLDRDELAALLDRGLANGGHPLDAYVEARDAADATAWVAQAWPVAVGDPRPLITIEDVRRLHTLAAARVAGAKPGAWRLRVAERTAAFVPPAPWNVPGEMGALVDRFRHRPDDADTGRWIAGWLARFSRILPFTAANGRTSRLCAALLLRRIDAPPLAVARDAAPLYRRALAGAIAGKPAAFETLVERTLGAALLRLIAAGTDEPLVPLRTLAGPREYAALVKAAQRGRLTATMLDGRLVTSARWIARYRSRSTR